MKTSESTRLSVKDQPSIQNVIRLSPDTIMQLLNDHRKNTVSYRERIIRIVESKNYKSTSAIYSAIISFMIFSPIFNFIDFVFCYIVLYYIIKYFLKRRAKYIDTRFGDFGKDESQAVTEARAFLETAKRENALLELPIFSDKSPDKSAHELLQYDNSVVKYIKAVELTVYDEVKKLIHMQKFCKENILYHSHLISNNNLSLDNELSADNKTNLTLARFSSFSMPDSISHKRLTDMRRSFVNSGRRVGNFALHHHTSSKDFIEIALKIGFAIYMAKRRLNKLRDELKRVYPELKKRHNILINTLDDFKKAQSAIIALQEACLNNSKGICDVLQAAQQQQDLSTDQLDRLKHNFNELQIACAIVIKSS